MEYDVEYQQVVNVEVEEQKFTLNLMGTLFGLDGANGQIVIVPDFLMEFSVGQTTNEVDVSAFVDNDRGYAPILIAEDSVAEHTETRCMYNSSTKKVIFYTDNTSKMTTGNNLLLIPTGGSQGTVIGITNGQYYGANTVKSKYGSFSVTFPANNNMQEIDVSSIVNANVLYTPYVFVDTQYTKTLGVNAVYLKSSKVLRLYRESSSSSLSFVAYVTLIASDNQSGTSAVGFTNGQFYDGYNRSYSKSETDTLLAAKQSIIDSSHKLSADLVDDTSTTNKFVTASEKSTWNSKQNAITGAATSIVSDNLTGSRALVSDSSGKVGVSLVLATELNRLSGVTGNVQNQINGKQATIDSSHKLSADLVDDTSTTNKFVTASEKTTWNGKQDALTFDSTPIQGSTNPVTSGGLYDIIGDVVTLINAL